jgi:cytochrome c oxidase assembly protein subunit 16
MPVFQSKPFRPSTTSSSTLGDRIGSTYRAHLTKHPFLLFGLPFIGIMVAGSFFLTPATALRYERHDRKVQQLSKEEAMGLGLKGPDGDTSSAIKRNPRRRVIGSEREEYYVGLTLLFRSARKHFSSKIYANWCRLQKLMAKDLDSWEQKRVKRFEGEPDGRL